MAMLGIGKQITAVNGELHRGAEVGRSTASWCCNISAFEGVWGEMYTCIYCVKGQVFVQGRHLHAAELLQVLT